MSVASRPDVTAVLGGIGAGKSLWIKQRLRAERPARVVVFDPQGEYRWAGQVVTLRDLHAELYGSTFRLVYVPAPRDLARQFDVVCRLVYATGRLRFVVDELHLFTSPRPEKVPPAWSALVLRSRHRAVSIVGASQRPAHLDKNFLGSATLIHCGRLAYAPDAKAAAEQMGVDWRRLVALRPLDWIERDAAGGLRVGRVRVPT